MRTSMVVFMLGITLFCLGIFLWSRPLGFIVTGLIFTAVGAISYSENKKDGRP